MILDIINQAPIITTLGENVNEKSGAGVRG